jgi:hypothetical protein
MPSSIGSSSGNTTEGSYLSRISGAVCRDVLIGNGNMLRLRGDLPEGEFSIRSWVSAWQFRTETRIVAASSDEGIDSGVLTALVREQRIESVTAEEVSRNLRVDLANGCSLLLVVTQSDGDDFSSEWSVHAPGDQHLMVIAGGRWAVKESS